MLNTCTHHVRFGKLDCPRAAGILKDKMCAAHRGPEFFLNDVGVRRVYEQVNVCVLGDETAAAHRAEQRAITHKPVASDYFSEPLQDADDVFSFTVRDEGLLHLVLVLPHAMFASPAFGRAARVCVMWRVIKLLACPVKFLAAAGGRFIDRGDGILPARYACINGCARAAVTVELAATVELVAFANVVARVANSARSCGWSPCQKLLDFSVLFSDDAVLVFAIVARVMWRGMQRNCLAVACSIVNLKRKARFSARAHTHVHHMMCRVH